jgi:hypothetical protein
MCAQALAACLVRRWPPKVTWLWQFNVVRFRFEGSVEAHYALAGQCLIQNADVEWSISTLQALRQHLLVGDVRLHCPDQDWLNTTRIVNRLLDG